MSVSRTLFLLSARPHLLWSCDWEMMWEMYSTAPAPQAFVRLHFVYPNIDTHTQLRCFSLMLVVIGRTTYCQKKIRNKQEKWRPTSQVAQSELI